MRVRPDLDAPTGVEAITPRAWSSERDETKRFTVMLPRLEAQRFWNVTDWMKRELNPDSRLLVEETEDSCNRPDMSVSRLVWQWPTISPGLTKVFHGEQGD